MLDPRSAYERLRAAHLTAVSAALEDHLGRLEWSRTQIERHRERSSFYAERLRGIEDREAIRQAWDATVHNLWGSTEIGVHAVGCGHGEGLHVCEDEVTFLSGECPCGSAFLRVADVTGRRDDDFSYGAITLPASAFRYVLGYPQITVTVVEQLQRHQATGKLTRFVLRR